MPGVIGMDARFELVAGKPLAMDRRRVRLGDANADGIVSFADITSTMGNWGGACP